MASGRPPAPGSAGRPRALLFDWDNTLVDTWHAIHHALAVTFEAMDMVPWTFEETRQRVRASARDTFPGMFGARAEEATTIFYDSFEAGHLENLVERPGADDMLRRLHGLGYYMAVVSNKRGDLLRREAARLDWAGLFGALVGANDAARDKPAEEPVLMALGDSGVSLGNEVWFVGDTDIDLVCATNTGCVPVLLRSEPPRVGEFPGHAPAHHFVNCVGLADHLASPVPQD